MPRHTTTNIFENFEGACAAAKMSRRPAINATRLWNWVDCQPYFEVEMWEMLRWHFPSMFWGDSTNNFRFTYHSRLTGGDQ